MISRLEFKVFGEYTEGFITDVMCEGIRLYNISYGKDCITVEILPKHYLKVARIARQNGIKTKIKKRKGIGFKFHKYRSRYGAALGILSFCLVILLLGNYVWDIKITGNKELTDMQILQVLKEQGIDIGVNRDSFDKTQSELNSILELKKLAWINIERNGSRVNVKLSERIKDEAPKIPLSEPCNIVASRDAQIITADVYKGLLVAEKGSGVAKGDIIISGVVDNNNGGIMYNHASGKIIGEFSESKEFYLPFANVESVLEKESIINEYATFCGFEMPLSGENLNAEDSKIETEMHNVEFFGLKMPWKIKKVINTPYKKLVVTRNKEEVVKKLESELTDYVANFYKNSQIMKIDKRFVPDKNGIKLLVDITARGEIGEQKEISIKKR